MKRKIDSESLPLKNWKKEAAMFQDDYTAGAGTSWLLNVAKAENKMIWEMIRTIEEAPILTPPNEPLTLDELREMDGEPVWFDGIKRWGIVKKCHDGVFVLTKSGEFEVGRSKYYRRPPEGEENA